MKKTIKILSHKIEKLQDPKNGTLQGGFGSLKGGFSDLFFSTNTSCTNSNDCTHSTNTGTPTCTNSKVCIM
jgi:hypothetical protein